MRRTTSAEKAAEQGRKAKDAKMKARFAGGTSEETEGTVHATAGTVSKSSVESRGKSVSSPGPSRLDTSDPLSNVHSSRNYGWFNLFFVVTLFLVVGNNITSFVEEGRVAGLAELLELFSPGIVVVTAQLVAGAFFAFYPLAFLAGRRIVRGGLVTVLLSLATAAYLLALGRLVWTVADLPAPQRAFFLALAAMLWMKGHSFVLAHAAAGRPNSLGSFVFFICCPVLVFRFDFQRTARVRRGYVLQKIGLGCLLFAGLHNLSVFYIVPVMLSAQSLPMVVFVSRLLVPMTAFYVLLFFLVFECILNLSAEVTHFAERRFYDDWWNSTTFSEFARTWNRPVHEWLLAHIYSDALSRNLSKNAALLLTFLFSAVGHELVLMVLVKSWRPFLFPLQMSQVGLIMFEKKLKGTQLGNYLFHFGICVGIPLLSCLYAREYALNRLAMPLSQVV